MAAAGQFLSWAMAGQRLAMRALRSRRAVASSVASELTVTTTSVLLTSALVKALMDTLISVSRRSTSERPTDPRGPSSIGALADAYGVQVS